MVSKSGLKRGSLLYMVFGTVALLPKPSEKSTITATLCPSKSPVSSNSPHLKLYLSERIESALRGAIYDPYIRWIIKEGLLGWWKDEYLDWARCPGVPSATRVVGEYPSTRQALIYNAKTAASPQDDPSLPACPLHWSAPIHQLNCDVVFPPELDRPDPSGRHVLTTLAQSLFGWFGLESLAEPPLLELDTPAYAGKIREHKVVEKLLAMGGVRLAAILNDMFDSE